MSKERRPARLLTALCAVLVVTCLVHLSQGGGSSSIHLSDVLPELFKGRTGDTTANILIWNIRMPRMFAALFAGAILGAVGSAFQAYFRNPLAEPYIVGVSSGAGLGGTIALVFGFSQAFYSLGSLAMAFVGGAASLWLVFALARRGGAVQVHTLLLAGVVTSAMLASLMTTVLMLGGQDTGKILRWLLGSVSVVFYERVWAMGLALAVGLMILHSQTRKLNAFAVSEFSAERLGIDPRALQRKVLLTATAMVSVTVGAVGIIGFLGLMAPHIARRVVGIDLRWSLPASAVCGSALLLLSDLAAQNINGDYELPVGTITALIGAPALLLLLKKEG